MPFQSEKQRRYMWSQHPEIARRWADEQKAKGEPQVVPSIVREMKRRTRGHH